MSGLQCAFCDHANPVEAKYCNACGSPLNLRPCTECDAVNEEAATACYKCGADLREAQAKTPVSPATTSIAEPALVVGAEVEHPPSTQSSVDIFGLFERPATLEADREPHDRPDASHRVQRDWREYVFGVLPTRHPDSTASFSTKAASTEQPAALLQALLTALVVVALTVWAYYAYRSPILAGTWLHAPRSGAEPASVSSQTPPVLDVAKTFASNGARSSQSDSAANAASVPSGADSDRDVGGPGTEREPRNDTVYGTATTVGADAPAASEAPAAAQAVPPSDLATSTNASGISATEPPAPATRPRQGSGRASSNRAPPARPNAVVPAAPGDLGSRGPLRSNPRIAECTDAIAALGFCDRPTREESR